jgi:hypothetical protein
VRKANDAAYDLPRLEGIEGAGWARAISGRGPMDNLELPTQDSEQYHDLTEISFGVRFLTLAYEKFVGSTGATGVLIS